MHNSRENIPENIRYRLVKNERLSSRKVIEKLFAEGESFLVYPVKVVYIKIEPDHAFPAKVTFAVSKKLYKKAVHRNMIKRRMREAYRLNKHQLLIQNRDSTIAVVFIYIGKQIMEYSAIEKAIIRSLIKLKNVILNP
jgi:ribonuclease P protein component